MKVQLSSVINKKDTLQNYKVKLSEAGFKDIEIKDRLIYLNLESLNDLVKIIKALDNELIINTGDDDNSLFIHIYDDYIE